MRRSHSLFQSECHLDPRFIISGSLRLLAGPATVTAPSSTYPNRLRGLDERRLVATTRVLRDDEVFLKTIDRSAVHTRGRTTGEPCVEDNGDRQAAATALPPNPRRDSPCDGRNGVRFAQRPFPARARLAQAFFWPRSALSRRPTLCIAIYHRRGYQLGCSEESFALGKHPSAAKWASRRSRTGRARSPTSATQAVPAK